jgi:cytoskeletal protein CcmA (bactofilin family)
VSHPTELNLMMYAEEGLNPTAPNQEALGQEGGAEWRRVHNHVKHCATCRNAVDQLRQETQGLSSALAMATCTSIEIPNPGQFQPKRGLRDLTLATIAVTLTTALVQWSWKALFEELILGGIAWAASTWTPNIYTVSHQIFLFMQEEGIDMFYNHLALIITVIGLLSLFGVSSIWRKSGAVPAVLLTLGVGTTLIGLPPQSHALQIIQQDDSVIVAASETINDTLLITTRTATIHGDIMGNLFVAAEDIEVTGDISGNLLTVADNVTISGSIGGMTVSLADTIIFEDANIAGDLWLAGDTIKLDATSETQGNLASFSSSLAMKAKIAKDMLVAAERVVVSGAIGGNLNAATKHISLLDYATVGGDIIYRTSTQDQLVLGDDVIIQGEIDYQGKPQNFQARNRFQSDRFYLWELLWFVGAFVVGWLLFTLAPSLGRVALGHGKESVKTAGIGFLVLVTVPIVAVIIAITVIGLPLSFITIVAWLTAWYLAKIVLAHLIGRSILAGRSEHSGLVPALFVGLIIVIIAINLPFLGGVLNLLATILGLGLMAQLWLNRDSREPEAG